MFTNEILFLVRIVSRVRNCNFCSNRLMMQKEGSGADDFLPGRFSNRMLFLFVAIYICLTVFFFVIFMSASDLIISCMYDYIYSSNMTIFHRLISNPFEFEARNCIGCSIGRHTVAWQLCLYIKLLSISLNMMRDLIY